jgi:hypothetical protein
MVQERQLVNTFKAPPVGSQETAANFKKFTVERSDFIELPGCLSVTEIRLDGHIIPPYEDREVLANTTGATKPIRVQLYSLQDSIHGPILMRSEQSNDGAWQAGSTIWVSGTWQDDQPATSGKK